MKFVIPRTPSPSPERKRVYTKKSGPGFRISMEDLESSDEEDVQYRDFAYESNGSDSDGDERMTLRRP